MSQKFTILQGGVFVFLIAHSCSETAFSQGTVGFAATPRFPVLYQDGSEFGTPSGPEVRVGFYFSDDLEAPPSEFVLGGLTDVVVVGIFNNGGFPLELPLPIGTTVISEIRAWTHNFGNYTTYEDALASGDHREWAGVSGVIRPLRLGGGATPAPNIYIQGDYRGIWLTQVPEPSIFGLALVSVLNVLWIRNKQRIR